MSPDDVLVVTVRKSFWASPEAQRFPRRIYARVFWGHSTNLANSLVVFAKALFAVAVRRPRVVLLGSVERTVPWFIRARRYGLLGRAKLVVTNQLYLSDAQLAQVERVILYARPVIEEAPAALRKRAVFFPLPADGDFEAARRAASPGNQVFAGGGADRDFSSLIEALRGTDVQLEIVTFSPERLGELPGNVRVTGRMPLQEFLVRMASALCVVVPLRSGASAHGQTSVVQALALGKAIVATRSSSVSDYLADGVDSLLVDAGDVAGYRDAVLRLATDEELRAKLEGNARVRAALLGYDRFAEHLVALLEDLSGR